MEESITREVTPGHVSFVLLAPLFSVLPLKFSNLPCSVLCVKTQNFLVSRLNTNTDSVEISLVLTFFLGGPFHVR